MGPNNLSEEQARHARYEARWGICLRGSSSTPLVDVTPVQAQRAACVLIGTQTPHSYVDSTIT